MTNVESIITGYISKRKPFTVFNIVQALGYKKINEEELNVLTKQVENIHKIVSENILEADLVDIILKNETITGLLYHSYEVDYKLIKPTYNIIFEHIEKPVIIKPPTVSTTKNDDIILDNDIDYLADLETSCFDEFNTEKTEKQPQKQKRRTVSELNITEVIKSDKPVTPKNYFQDILSTSVDDLLKVKPEKTPKQIHRFSEDLTIIKDSLLHIVEIPEPKNDVLDNTTDDCFIIKKQMALDEIFLPIKDELVGSDVTNEVLPIIEDNKITIKDELIDSNINNEVPIIEDNGVTIKNEQVDSNITELTEFLSAIEKIDTGTIDKFDENISKQELGTPSNQELIEEFIEMSPYDKKEVKITEDQKPIEEVIETSIESEDQELEEVIETPIEDQTEISKKGIARKLTTVLFDDSEIIQPSWQAIEEKPDLAYSFSLQITQEGNVIIGLSRLQNYFINNPHFNLYIYNKLIILEQDLKGPVKPIKKGLSIGKVYLQMARLSDNNRVWIHFSDDHIMINDNFNCYEMEERYPVNVLRMNCDKQCFITHNKLEWLKDAKFNLIILDGCICFINDKDGVYTAGKRGLSITKTFLDLAGLGIYNTVYYHVKDGDIFINRKKIGV